MDAHNDKGREDADPLVSREMTEEERSAVLSALRREDARLATLVKQGQQAGRRSTITHVMLAVALTLSAYAAFKSLSLQVKVNERSVENRVVLDRIEDGSAKTQKVLDIAVALVGDAAQAEQAVLLQGFIDQIDCNDRDVQLEVIQTFVNAGVVEPGEVAVNACPTPGPPTDGDGG